nr:RNA-directed DNA polymerase, eukaryota, reverse transcriptase zinc-binding domain protein [Tanacetum cinerariifolium]
MRLSQLSSRIGKFSTGHLSLMSNNKKASWVRWSSVLTNKHKGGLGVASLYALNRGLMLKWAWRFYSHKHSLWARVVRAIHGENGGVNKVVSGSNSCWRNIVKEVLALQDQGIIFFEYMKLKVGDGSSKIFWEDNWIAGGALKDRFPRVYALETCKQADRYVWTLNGSGEYSVASMRKILDDFRAPTTCSPTR